MSTSDPLVLGLHPSSRGFGWVVFDAPLSPFDWGITDIRGGNSKALLRVDGILARYEPTAVALEEFEKSRRVARTISLCRAIVVHAEQRGIAVHRYTRENISAVLHPARTRQEVAEGVAMRIGELQGRLPRPRKIWDGEHPNMALFCAAACVIVHHESRIAISPPPA
jgi:hypothetical protein